MYWKSFLQSSPALRVSLIYCWRRKLSEIIPQEVLTLPRSCQVVYCHTAEECSSICRNILHSAQNRTVVGFDAEWRPIRNKHCVNKVALVQICISLEKCFIFHLSRIGYVPDSMLMVLNNPNIFKAGVSVENDLIKLSRDYSIEKLINMKNVINLSEYANSIGLTRPGKCNWGLKALCGFLVQKSLKKDKEIRLSDWEAKVLSKEQLEYAALDAFLGLLLFQLLEKERISKQLPLSSVPYLTRKVK